MINYFGTHSLFAFTHTGSLCCTTLHAMLAVLSIICCYFVLHVFFHVIPILSLVFTKLHRARIFLTQGHSKQIYEYSNHIYFDKKGVNNQSN